MSLGGRFKSRTEENAFNDANKAGVLSIAAAGNAGNNTTSYPAGYASVMSVAAVDANEAKKESFSQSNKDVEIAAPGVAVLSTSAVAGSEHPRRRQCDVVRRPPRRRPAHHGGGRSRGRRPVHVSGGMVRAKWCCVSEAASRLPTRSPTFRGGMVLRQSFTTAPRTIRRAAWYSGTLGTQPTTTIAAITLSCSRGAPPRSPRPGLDRRELSKVPSPFPTAAMKRGTARRWPHRTCRLSRHSSGAAIRRRTNQQIRNALTSYRPRQGRPGPRQLVRLRDRPGKGRPADRARLGILHSPVIRFAAF